MIIFVTFWYLMLNKGIPYQYHYIEWGGWCFTASNEIVFHCVKGSLLSQNVSVVISTKTFPKVL